MNVLGNPLKDMVRTGESGVKPRRMGLAGDMYGFRYASSTCSRRPPIAGECVDLPDYEVLWDGSNPNSAWAPDSAMVWVRWAGNTDPVNDGVTDWTFQIGERWTYFCQTLGICCFIWTRKCRTNVQFPCLFSYNIWVSCGAHALAGITECPHRSSEIASRSETSHD